MLNTLKPRWLVEVVAVWGYVQRNYFLTKRYFMWELVWLTFTTIYATFDKHPVPRPPDS
jgi:hypothetical protein